MRPRLLVLALAGGFLAAAVPARAGSLILRSSAAFSAADGAAAVVADAQDNLIFGGSASGNFHIFRADKNLVFLSSITFDAGGAGDAIEALAVDAQGNVIAAGYNASQFVTAKFNSDLVLLSSATYAPGSGSRARAMAVDADGNIIVAGQRVSGTNVYTIMKYDSNLVQIGAGSYNSGGQDIAFGVDTDSSGNIYVTGQSLLAGNFDFLTVKFTPDLSSVLGLHRFDLQARQDQARAIAVDGAGNVYVTGQSLGANFDYLTVKYDSNLAVVSSITFDSGGTDAANGVAVDARGNVYVTGESDGAGDNDFLTFRYTSSLTLDDSAIINGGAADRGRAVALDSTGNIIVAGESGGPAVPAALKYNGPPFITSVSSGTQGDNFQVRVIAGGNFVSGSAVSFSSAGLTVNGAAPDNPEQLRFSANVQSSVILGRYGILVTNPDGQVGALADAFEIRKAKAITAAGGGTITTAAPNGNIIITIPGGAFPANFTASVGIPLSVPDSGALFASGITMETFQEPIVGQPTANFTIEMGYQDSDVLGLDESSLVIAYYDTGGLAWVPLVSVVDPVVNTVIAVSDHFTQFALLARATAKSPYTEVVVYPNPYKSGSDGDYGDPEEGRGIVFGKIPRVFRLKIFNVAGELVFDRTDRASFGKYFWDTLNEAGMPVASGVYVFLAYSESGQLVNRGKFSIIR